MRNRIKRLALICAGWFFVATGIVGIFLPLLPTTPFLLLAAACFSRSSESLHSWLLQHPTFGKSVGNWERYRVIPKRAKILSSTMMTVMIGYPVFVYPHPLWFKAFLVLTCLAVSRFIWSCPHSPPKASLLSPLSESEVSKSQSDISAVSKSEVAGVVAGDERRAA